MGKVVSLKEYKMEKMYAAYYNKVNKLWCKLNQTSKFSKLNNRKLFTLLK